MAQKKHRVNCPKCGKFMVYRGIDTREVKTVLYECTFKLPNGLPHAQVLRKAG